MPSKSKSSPWNIAVELNGSIPDAWFPGEKGQESGSDHLQVAGGSNHWQAGCALAKQKTISQHWIVIGSCTTGSKYSTLQWSAES